MIDKAADWLEKVKTRQFPAAWQAYDDVRQALEELIPKYPAGQALGGRR